jgi:ketosteroid isomerase-like protein
VEHSEVTVASNCGSVPHDSAEETAIVSTPRKAVVETYFEGFRHSDHAMVLSCLTEDVTWDLPGFKHLTGKAAFDGEIENPEFTGSPTLEVDRLIEEGATVVALGTGATTHKSGSVMRFAFSDVFTFADDRHIARVESYVVPLT